MIGLLKQAALYFGIGLSLMLIYGVGHIRFGYSWRATKRLALCLLGCASCILGVLVLVFGAGADNPSWALVAVFLFGGFFLSGGIACITCGLLASNDKVDAWFEGFLDGF